MARKKKLPKKPRMSSSIEVWKRWEAKAKKVKAFNDTIDRVRKAKDAIRTRY
jgi:hypothetical protein